jgi:multiple sugar transport system ATP-binding protein
VFGAEYLGTTQIITITTAHGMVKARAPASVRVERAEPVGLSFRADRLSLFDGSTGRAIRTALHEQPVRGGRHG